MHRKLLAPGRSFATQVLMVAVALMAQSNARPAAAAPTETPLVKLETTTTWI